MILINHIGQLQKDINGIRVDVHGFHCKSPLELIREGKKPSYCQTEEDIRAVQWTGKTIHIF